jgi:Flp pilus assembly protein TadD/outer membrane protein OmpA-like peptidoglycan-associated protein
MQHKLWMSAALVAAVAALSSCSKMGALSADLFNVTPTPLETKAGQVEATISGSFPSKYMKKKAVVTVTPVLKYDGQETASESATFQGEKVEGNDQTVSYRVGGNYSMKANWMYVPAMINSDLYLQFNAKKGKKNINIPEVKVGYGVVATSELLSNCLANANACVAEDAFQRVIQEKQTANIRFLIGQVNLRTGELKSVSVADFVKTLKEISKDKENKAISNVEVSAYASPDGAYSLNEKLAQGREKVATNYVKKNLKSNKLDDDVESKYTAEDWDGFQELVQASNLQDKDVILRVLSMYQDPEEREQQIRNISTVYSSLATEVLPELRRARMTINYEVIGRDDDQIIAEFNDNNAKGLSLEELIYGGNMLVETDADRIKWYNKAIEMYPNDYRAYNNIASILLQNGDTNGAEQYLTKALNVDSNAGEVYTNKALVALKQGATATAEQYLSKASGNTVNETVGALAIAQGKYAQAAQYLEGSKSNTAALAQILNKDYSAAAQTLSNVSNADATTTYLQAILAARTGNKSQAKSLASQAAAASSVYKALADKDLELK